MSTLGQLYTSGLWTVKPGHEQAFIAAWQAFATWTTQHQPGAGAASLLQDLEHSNRFVSFGPWERLEDIAAWRSQPEFLAFVRQVRELCEAFEPRRLSLVAYAAPASAAADD